MGEIIPRDWVISQSVYRLEKIDLDMGGLRGKEPSAVGRVMKIVPAQEEDAQAYTVMLKSVRKVVLVPQQYIYSCYFLV